MGYKLAGFKVLGCVEIDPKMLECYRTNLSPPMSFLMGVQKFNEKQDIPSELFDIDVLDGSPPCTSFSFAGLRDKTWGKEKVFSEGAALQRLDDLFFHFIETAKKLRPKVVIAENVKGLINGAARGYVKEIFAAFTEAGYSTQLFLLDASRMGVPQRRERVFFVASRSDLGFEPLTLSFCEKQKNVREAWMDLPARIDRFRMLTPLAESIYQKTQPGRLFRDVTGGSWFTHRRLSFGLPSFTLDCSSKIFHPEIPRFIDGIESVRIQTFPDDYNFCRKIVPHVCGMSVPPFMMQRLSLEVARQMFDRKVVG